MESFEIEYLATLNPVLEAKERGKVVAVEVACAAIVAKVVRSFGHIALEAGKPVRDFRTVEASSGKSG